MFLALLFAQITFSQTLSLKGGVSHSYIPQGFFGSWGVISKLKETNNPDKFNFQSKDIWTLSGYNNVLILENIESGAKSEIIVKDKSIDGKTLKFERKREKPTAQGREIHREIVQFTLLGKNFSGYDKFIIEKYDKNNNLIKKDSAQYQVEGVRISGQD